MTGEPVSPHSHSQWSFTLAWAVGTECAAYFLLAQKLPQVLSHALAVLIPTGPYGMTGVFLLCTLRVALVDCLCFEDGVILLGASTV